MDALCAFIMANVGRVGGLPVCLSDFWAFWG